MSLSLKTALSLAITAGRQVCRPAVTESTVKLDAGSGATGYGRMGMGASQAQTFQPTRLCGSNFAGRYPPDLSWINLCRVKHCVNPDHLEPVTHTENVRRGGAAKLTLEIAEAIRSDPRSGRRIALAYGVCQTTVVQIKQGKTWVPGAESLGGIGQGDLSDGLRRAS